MLPATYFKPAGVPLRLLEEVALAVEEAEAIRLKDLLGLEQQECAEKMAISRPDLCGLEMDVTARSDLYNLESLDYGTGCQ